MLLAYNCKELKHIASEIHRKYPYFNILYLENISDYVTINSVLASGNIDVYLYGGPTKEPYVTREIWSKFNGRIINMTMFYEKKLELDGEMDMPGFFMLFEKAIDLKDQ